MHRSVYKCLCELAGCTNNIMTSDHSPVFASFEVGVASQYVSKQGMTPPTHPTYATDESAQWPQSDAAFIFQIPAVRLLVEFRS